MLRSGLLATLLGLGVVPSPESDEVAVAALEIEIEGSLPQAWQTKADRKLRQGLARGALRLVPPGEFDPACRGSDCAQRIGSSTGADYLVRTTLEVGPEGRDYALRIGVVSTATGREVAVIEGRCDLCGLQEAVDVVEARAATVPAAIERVSLVATSLSFSSVPSGARLRVDGEDVGTAPLSIPIEPGLHRVEASLPGHVEDVVEVEVVEGVGREVQLTLAPVPAAQEPDRADAGPGRPLLIGGAVLTGVGVVALAAGGTLVGVHDRPYRADCEADAEGDCRFVYDTRAGGVAGLAVGAVSIAAGVALMVVGRRRGRVDDMQARVGFGAHG
ncbi:MAG: PEGA domain-containing protein, partial [Deltaproteobacteria bacterium]|nr:PEGA domain-containing protein [Deltaproteobacteria bacterium]